MQTLDSFYETAIKRGHHVVGAPLIVAEWNFNNIYEPTVTNPPDDQNWAYGQKYFPPKSVSNSIRPKSSGIFAAFTQDASTTSDTTLGVAGNRYYTTGSDPEKVFTYWICPTVSDIYKVGTTETGEEETPLPDHYGVSRGTLLLEYPEYVNANKIRVLFNLGPTPVDWSIFLHTEGAPGDGYVEVENPTVDPITGKAEVWWNGTAWVEVQQLNEPIYARVDKIKVEVRAVDQPGKYLQVVEVMAGREIDLTPRVQDYTVNYQMDDVDFIAPVGRLVSADGRITFNNTDLKINEQVDSDFAGLLRGRCEYRMYVKYDMSDYGGGDVIMRTGTLYANDWQQINEYEYQVEMWDILKLLQITKLPGRLFENMSLAKILSQILDSVGIDSYNLDPDDFDDSSIVKYFWASGDDTVFDVLDNLCKSYQAAIFVDEFGVIQFLTRTQIANETDTPVWTFRGETVGDDIADIQTLQKKYNLQANTVTIKYKQKEAKVDATDVTQQPLTSKIWEATDTVVLRAAPLTRQLSADGSYDHPTWERDVWIPASVAPTWPYKGKVNVDGELIEYNAKGYQKWDYSTNPPTVAEVPVKSNEDKLRVDRETYASFLSNGLTNPGGISSDPSKQNRFTGRLIVSKRDSGNGGRQAAHYPYWNYGWMGMKGWTLTPGNPSFPGKYVEPGGSVYSMANVQNHKARPGWTSVQTRWSMSNSIVKCNNLDGNHNVSMLIRDVGNTECREIGTRLRLNGDFACGGIIFYLSNGDGYDTVNPPLTDPHQADRYYILNVVATSTVEKRGRNTGLNEISLEVKNGNTLTKLQSTRGYKWWGGPPVGKDGVVTIDKNKWYDIDIVVKDAGRHGRDTSGATGTKIEVYVDGQWIDTWMTSDNIRPTGLMGIHSRQKSIAEFEYFYATGASSALSPGYIDDDDFNMQIFTLPPGTSAATTLNLAPTFATGYQSVLSFSTTGSPAIINSLKVKGNSGSTFRYTKELGPITINPDSRVIIDLDSSVERPAAVDVIYTSTTDVSVCWEYTIHSSLLYSIDDVAITPPDHSFYDVAKGGFLSTRLGELSNRKAMYPVYTEGSVVIDNRFLFSEDFGAVVHEVRDFEVDYDAAPAKGVRVYVSNNNVRIVDHTYNPEKGIFTLANASNRDEIVNGTEEVTDTESIDHILMLYGYILEDRGEKTKEVKNESSIRRYGPISTTIDADWIFSEAEAEALGDWIVEHWSDPMDTVTLEVFSNTFTQIGDKVNIVYENANILSSWLYIVSERSSTFDGDGLATSVTLRRVR